jgi:hypothetical protein
MRMSKEFERFARRDDLAAAMSNGDATVELYTISVCSDGFRAGY